MTQYYVRRDVYLCLIDGATIFLSLRNGKYQAISGPLVELLSQCVCGWPQCELPASPSPIGPIPIDDDDERLEAVESLVHAGLLTHDVNDARPSPFTSTRACSAVEYPRPYETRHIPSPMHVLRFFAAVLSVRVRMRISGGASHLIREVAHRNATHAARSSRKSIEHGTALTRIFESLRIWTYTARELCLADSLILANFLQRNHVYPTFVIGIGTKPFSAHAWVQIDDIVLNDKVERVYEYTPILVV